MVDHLRARLSRRELGRLAAGAAGIASALALPAVPAQARPPRQEGEPTPGGAVEQVRWKRAGDPDRAYAGFTLFTPGGPGSRTVYLISMDGSVVHTWEVPYAPGSYGYLTERGTLFYNGTVPNPDYPRRTAQAGAALETDWNGRILWEVRNPDHHHDGIRLRNGNVLLDCYGVLPADLAAQVQGGVPGSERPWGIDGDYLQEVTTDGRVVWEWRAWEHLDPVQDGIPWPMDSRDAWTHCNGIAEWPNGDITLSFRNLSKFITISRQTGEVLWKLGLPLTSGQHNPTPLPNGHLLIFDNGPHRLPDPEHDPEGIESASFPYSRVLELAVPSGEIVWRYQEPRVSDFFSPRISSAQRLPNGNTLINEGWFGRFFEVTPEGDVVWEYVNPYFHATPVGQFNQVFRAYRYSAEEIERARATAS
jgi:hypothetical protein